MKGDRLGEFEEFTLMAVRALAGTAYGVPIQRYLEEAMRRTVSLGAVYAALDRLEQKGFLRSEFGESTPERGGKRKREFEITPVGMRALRDLRRIRDRIWQAIDAGQQS